MNKLLIITTLACLIYSHAFNQRLDSYSASNGVTYHVGDTIILGRGSATNQSFQYLQIGGWAVSADADQNNIGRHYSGLPVFVKKIKSFKWRGAEKIVFIVDGGNITNYNLYIEDAIATCEVKDCGKQKTEVAETDKYDKLKKLKLLLDDGTLTQEEYDKEKSKILNGN